MSASHQPELAGQTLVVLAIHVMVNTAVTGATYEIDGGQQLVEG